MSSTCYDVILLRRNVSQEVVENSTMRTCKNVLLYCKITSIISLNENPEMHNDYFALRFSTHLYTRICNNIIYLGVINIYIKQYHNNNIISL